MVLVDKLLRVNRSLCYAIASGPSLETLFAVCFVLTNDEYDMIGWSPEDPMYHVTVKPNLQ